jgi:hypothetical protein
VPGAARLFDDRATTVPGINRLMASAFLKIENEQFPEKAVILTKTSQSDARTMKKLRLNGAQKRSPNLRAGQLSNTEQTGPLGLHVREYDNTERSGSKEPYRPAFNVQSAQCFCAQKLHSQKQLVSDASLSTLGKV